MLGVYGGSFALKDRGIVSEVEQVPSFGFWGSGLKFTRFGD